MGIATVFSNKMFVSKISTKTNITIIYKNLPIFSDFDCSTAPLPLLKNKNKSL